MNKLSIRLIESASLKYPQSIEISIESSSELHLLFTGRVDLPAFTEWFIENEDAIRKSDFPVDNLTQDSLAEKVHCFYENANVDDDDLIDAMFDYRASHCLRFACRGVNFPEIYIGKLGSGHEVSLFTQNENWQYFFDVDDFFCKLKC
ncbi:hypothetical protein [Ewingella americana]|uniref:hypothetical protein n=1 Tax=Ewingella americana TaxID=41202 RepID=UPI001639AE7A|nr:hypothetical protein [Ewingella americana]QMV53024.1 hypothetical protein GXP68_18035 [Ewingella americana]